MPIDPFSDRGPFRLGAWTVVPRELVLRRASDEDPVRLQLKEMQLLLALADREGRPLSSGDLREAVWGDQAITDGVAKNLVWQLRKSLGESADEPGLIETVPSAGYRLRTLPREIPEPSDERAAAEPAASHQPGHTSTSPTRRRALVVAALMLLVASAFLLLRFRSEPTSPTETKQGDSAGATSRLARSIFAPEVVPRLVVDLPGRESEIALDPSGRYLLFSHRGDSPADDLYVLDFDDPSEMPVQLTRTGAADRAGAWSLDGDRIAFVRSFPDTADREIHVMPAAGGTSRVVGLVTSIRDVDLEWRDAHSLFVSRVTASPVDDPQGIEILDLETGRFEYLTHHPDGQTVDRGPALSPDRKQLAFVRWQDATEGRLLCLDLESGKSRVLGPGMPGVSRPAWLPKGDHILFTGTDASLWRLWWVPADGSEPPSPFPTTTGAMDVGEVATSQSGVVAYEQSTFDLDVQRLDVRSRNGRVEPIGEPTTLVASDRAEMAATRHPNRQSVAFLSDRTGPVRLWLADGDDAPRMIDVEGVTWRSRPSWSPDGTLLVLGVQAGSQSDIALVRADNGRVDHLTETPEIREMTPTWRPDGLAVRFARPAEARDGTFDVWEQDLWRGGDALLVVRNALLTQNLPDGRMVALRNDLTLVLLDPRPGDSARPRDAGGAEATILPIELLPVDWGNWHATPNGVYWINVRTRILRYYDFATGAASEVATLEHPAAMEALRMAPDGESFYLTVMMRDDSRLLALRP